MAEEMGLSAGAIYVSEPGVGLELASHLGLIKRGASPIKHAESGFDVKDGVRIAAVPQSWSVILGAPRALLPRMSKLSQALTDQSKGRKILFWYTQSSTGGVMFEVHEDGVLQRKWIESEGQVIEDLGAPVPEEEGLVDRANHESGPLHSEWTVIAIAERMTGITVDQHFEMQGSVYAAAP